jgi:hypothetical protein
VGVWAKTIAGNITFEAKGGAGGGNASSNGGGGGGGGGHVSVFYLSKSGTVFINVSGGLAGASQGGGSNGVAGTVGTSVEVDL